MLVREPVEGDNGVEVRGQECLLLETDRGLTEFVMPRCVCLSFVDREVSPSLSAGEDGEWRCVVMLTVSYKFS